MRKIVFIMTFGLALILVIACGESSSPTYSGTNEDTANNGISAWSSSSVFIENATYYYSSSIQYFSFSSSDPAQNIRTTSGFSVRFFSNIDSTSGWMSTQTFFSEIPQYLEKNKYKKNNCSFQGWALSPEGEVVYKDGASVIVSSDVNLYAKWYCWEPLPKSSSSSVANSSSSSINYGQLIDERDGIVYKTVVIGKQTWMAENLNYAHNKSSCWHDSCSVFGRFYTWSVAMDSDAEFSKNGEGCGIRRTCSPAYPVRGICPYGWHLPTKAEYEVLLNFVGTDSASRSKALRSTGNEMYNKGIRNDYGWAGDNSYGFSVIRTSGIESGKMYYELYARAAFWTSNDYEENVNLVSDADDNAEYLSVMLNAATVGSWPKIAGLSIRCLKN